MSETLDKLIERYRSAIKAEGANGSCRASLEANLRSLEKLKRREISGAQPTPSQPTGGDRC
jgi:hypothetical protein